MKTNWRKMELSWDSSKNFSKYKCTIIDRDMESIEKEVNLLFVEINNCTFFFAFYRFHLLWKNESVAGKIWSVIVCSLQLGLSGAVESHHQCQGAFAAGGASLCIPQNWSSGTKMERRKQPELYLCWIMNRDAAAEKRVCETKWDS